MIKVGGIQNTQVLWEAVFLAALPLASGGFVVIKLPCGNSVYGSHELSNACNDHFSSIGPRLANNIHANDDNSSHLDYLAETGHCTFELKPTSIPKVPLLM